MATRQLIDANGVFLGGLPTASPEQQATNYRVVAVVGCQSGGKSTLLNHVFATTFPVLDAPKRGRRRTTLGVWAALAAPPTDVPLAQAVPTVVLDVEGTDSRERGEGARAFESRTTLLALALSDVVLVNMWAHDLGRHSAANYDLFETVFAHAVALRRAQANRPSRPPVSVTIIVRDHDGHAELEDIRRVLMGDLTNIWDRLRVRELSFSDLFKIDVVALPHKLYAPEEFSSSTRDLHIRVAADTAARVAHQPVPLDGFDALAQAVWDGVCACTGGTGINAESTLDLPRHAALAAYYRLGQTVDAVWAGEVGQRVDDLRVDIETNWQSPVEDFGARVNALARDALAQFDEAAIPYCESPGAGDAPKRRRDELGIALVVRIADLHERYMSACWDFCMNGFDDKFRPMLGGTRGFERRARRLAREFVKKYRTLAQAGAMPSMLRGFEQAREEEAEQRRKEEAEGLAVTGTASASASASASGEDGEWVRADEGGEDEYEAEVAQELGLIEDEEEEEADELSVEKFRKDLHDKVEERRRLGDLMLPGAGGELMPGMPKADPWWKGLLIRGVILLINYLQATHGQRAALRLMRKHEKEFPSTPSF